MTFAIDAHLAGSTRLYYPSLYLAAGCTPAEVANQLDHSLAMSMRTYQHLVEEYQGVEKKPIDGMIVAARGMQPVRKEYATEMLS